VSIKNEPERPYFAIAARGTEGVLRDELRELGIPAVRASRGGVHFGGDMSAAARVCLHSRIAVRVLEKVAQFPARDARQLYEGARLVEWERYLRPSLTLAVRASLRSSALTHSTFVSLKVKDAIVDRMRDRQGARPDIDRRDPDLWVNVHLVKDQAELFVDLSGEALHRRGYRTESGEAPLKETLAAAILRLSEWQPDRPLVDPMCGSGTLVIEAALQAYEIAPGLGRKRFGFERWARHDAQGKRRMSELRAQAREIQSINRHVSLLLGRDRDPHMLTVARANARRAGVSARWELGEVQNLRLSGPPGWIATNPPYGVRLAGADTLSTDMARSFRNLSGFRVCALVADGKLPAAMRLRPVIEHELWNGDIECRLFCWDIP
jgi:23S rRNA G2445 N2-methylase RlmL